jgi:O-antigen/teichoic acid export membrane protein
LHPDTPLLKKHLAYALPFALAVLIDITQANLHMYVVSYHFDAATFAIYAVGCLQIPLVDFMMTSTSSVMMVRMREHLQDGNSAAVLRIWDDTTRKLALVFVPLVGGLLVTADPLIPVLFTDRYAGSIQLFMLWTLSILFTALMTDSMLRVYAETRYLILLNLIRLVFVAITISWFLSRFGLLGAVLVTLFATVLSKLVAFIRIKRSLQCSLVQLLPWRSLGATLLIGATAALPTLAIKSALHIPPVPLLLVTGAVYAAAYAGLLILYGPLHSEERLLLLSWARRPVASVCRSLGI